jgi:ubiquinone/menaquinone biosynthesis C-methylase UbiE
MDTFDKLVEKTKSNYPGYKFSWEIYTDLILENIARKPYWLDIGAGKNIWIAEQPGAEFSVGLDIEKDADMVIDRETGGYVIAESEYLPFKDNSFGFITSRYTFEHLKSPEITLDEIHRVLKAGGKFAMQTTNKFSPAVLMARAIPFKIKSKILRKLFTEIPSGTYRAYYKLNSPRTIKTGAGRLKLKKLVLVEDIFCQSRILYILSKSIFKIMNLFGLHSLRNNIIAVYEKKINKGPTAP